MALPVSLQLHTALIYILLGAALGLVYDFLRALRGIHSGAVLSSAVDFLFWLIAALAMFSAAASSFDGAVRLYTFAFVGLGAIVYCLLLSAFSRCVFHAVLHPLSIALLAISRLIRRASLKLIKKYQLGKKNLAIRRKSSKMKNAGVPREDLDIEDKTCGYYY